MRDSSLELLGIAVEAARTAGEYIARHFGPGLEIETKAGHHDVVTEHDSHAEGVIRAHLLGNYPDSVVVGEEGGESGRGHVQWYVDPIDGTSNFAAGMPFYCVSIGAVFNGSMVAAAIYDPERDEMFTASMGEARLNGNPMSSRAHACDSDAVLLTGFPYEGGKATRGDLLSYGELLARFRGVRRLGSSALSLAYVAAGRVDVASELNANPWDIAAGLFLVQQAGGSFLVDTEPPTGGLGPEVDSPWLCPRWAAAGAGFDLEKSIIVEHLRRPLSATLGTITGEVDR